MTATASLLCPVCGNCDAPVIQSDLYDDRYGYPGKFNLRQCHHCGHQFLDARFSAAELGALYSNYYPRRHFDPGEWQPHRETGRVRAWLRRDRSSVYRWVPRGVRVLDVGCGFGESVGYHCDRGCDAHGVDPDENLRAVGEKFGLNVKVGLFRAADYEPASFDYVTLDQVIEHAVDPVGLLRDAASLLRPGGKLLLGTPNARSWSARALGPRWVHYHTPYHLQLFTAASLRAAAERAGLRVVSLRQLTSPEWYAFQWLHLLSRPAPETPSPFWCMNRPWPVAIRPLRRLISGVGRLGVNFVLAGATDALGCGENQIAVLERQHG